MLECRPPSTTRRQLYRTARCAGTQRRQRQHSRSPQPSAGLHVDDAAAADTADGVAAAQLAASSWLGRTSCDTAEPAGCSMRNSHAFMDPPAAEHSVGQVAGARPMLPAKHLSTAHNGKMTNGDNLMETPTAQCWRTRRAER